MLPFPASKPTITPLSGGAIAKVLIPLVHRVDRLLAALVLACLRAYKLFVSPLFAGCCRFEPSCADYTAEAVRTHGSMRGSWLGLRRLSRCRPLGGHGFDPVPPVAPRRR
jgi:putative membrane protein insertion efficiency factor